MVPCKGAVALVRLDPIGIITQALHQVNPFPASSTDIETANARLDLALGVIEACRCHVPGTVDVLFFGNKNVLVGFAVVLLVEFRQILDRQRIYVDEAALQIHHVAQIVTLARFGSYDFSFSRTGDTTGSLGLNAL